MYLFPFFSPSRFIFNHRSLRNSNQYKLFEYKDKFEIRLSALGRDLSAVNIQLSGQKLTIDIPASTLLPNDEHIEKVIWQELDLNAKNYVFTLNHHVDPKQIDAKVDQGILTITLIKKQAETHKIPVSFT